MSNISPRFTAEITQLSVIAEESPEEYDFVNEHLFCTSNANKEEKLLNKTFTQSGQTDSDESLGILPSDILDNSFDNLVFYEKGFDDQNNAVNRTYQMIKKLSDNDDLVFIDSNIKTVRLSKSCAQDVSSLDSYADCHYLSGLAVPVFASTPKHETCFEDISENIANVLNTTCVFSNKCESDSILQLSAEHCKYDEVIVEHSSKNKMTEDFIAVPNKEDEAEKCLNSTFTYSSHNFNFNELNGFDAGDVDRNSGSIQTFFDKSILNRTFEIKNSDESNCKPGDNKVLLDETNSILNGTFEIGRTELCERNIEQNSLPTQKSEILANKKLKTDTLSHAVCKSNAKISNIKFETRAISVGNNFEKGIDGSTPYNLSKAEKSNVHCKKSSMSSNVNSLKKSLPNVKVRVSPAKNVTTEHFAKQGFKKNLLTIQDAKNSSFSLKNDICQNIPKKSISSLNLKPECSKCSLNETIPISSKPVEVGKTVIKKSRYSVCSVPKLDEIEKTVVKKTRNSIGSTSRNSISENLKTSFLENKSRMLNCKIKNPSKSYKIEKFTYPSASHNNSRESSACTVYGNKTTKAKICAKSHSSQKISSLLINLSMKSSKENSNPSKNIHDVNKMQKPFNKNGTLCSRTSNSSHPIKVVDPKKPQQNFSKIPKFTLKVNNDNLPTTSRNYSQENKESLKLILKSASSTTKIKSSSQLSLHYK